MTIIPLQAAHTAKLILMELVRRYMQGVAKNEGQLGKNRTTLLERSSILEGNEIKEYFERTSPEIAGKYYE